MSQSGSVEGHTTISFRIDRERKREVRIRAAQQGYSNLTNYMHDLIEDDLQGANVPLE